MKLLEIDPKTGKYKLSHRVLIPKPEGYQERRPRGERGERPERGERRPRPERNGNGKQHGNGGNNRQRNDYHDPLADREPKDFNDSLDHSLDID